MQLMKMRFLKFVAGICAVTLIAVACSAATEGVAIKGLSVHGKGVVVDQAKSLPHLKACLGSRASISKRQFEVDCALPYLAGLWVAKKGLLRSHKDLPAAADDWLVKKPADGRWPIYYPSEVKAAKEDLDGLMTNFAASDITLKELPNPRPVPGTPEGEIYEQAGLMYLPNSYVVPGGIFNEMYGWDTYFIIRGLLDTATYFLGNDSAKYWDLDDLKMVELDKNTSKSFAVRLFSLAKGMADNHAFMINFYGGFVPNANRIYYLTRSQPPLFVREVKAIYDWAKKNSAIVPYRDTLSRFLRIKPATNYDEWLATEMLPAAKQYYDYWTDPTATVFGGDRNPRVAEVKGFRLPLYHADGVGPAAEIVNSKIPGNIGEYENVAAYFASFPEANPDNMFYDPAKSSNPIEALTAEFYTADRTVRASGYDLSGRYGVAGQWAAGYAPVALMALVYQMGSDINGLSKSAGTNQFTVPDADLEKFRHAARALYSVRRSDDKAGTFSDVWVGSGNRARPYTYATMFYPLWADRLVDTTMARQIASAAVEMREVSQDQLVFSQEAIESDASTARVLVDAGAIKTCALKTISNQPRCTEKTESKRVADAKFIDGANFGIPLSMKFTGDQWDYPNVWGPPQFFASEGLRNFGFKDLAKIADKGWIEAVDIGLAKSGYFDEKYVFDNPSLVPPVSSSYSEDQIGFGFTNAVYINTWMRENGQSQ